MNILGVSARTYKHLNLLEYNIQYWRTKTGYEVDFVIQNGTLAIECKSSDSIQKRDLVGLLAFKKDFPEAVLLLVCQETQIRMISIDDVQIKIYPIMDFLKDLWAGVVVK